MLQPVELANFFTVFFSAALVILCGALYALLFAWSRVTRRPWLMPWAYAAYLGLTASVIVLGRAANLFDGGLWTVVIALMLVGYLLAPHGVWHLCVGTHAQGDGKDSLSQPR